MPALLNATPLLEEEGNAHAVTPISKGENPIFLHGPSTWATLSPHDDPVDPPKWDPPKILKQWLYRQEPHTSWRRTKMINSWKTIPLVLYTDTPPYVRKTGSKP